jgi:hypothetical protein
MPPTVPSWFRYRQGKAEDAGPDLARLTGPNMLEAVIGIRKTDSGKFSAFLRGGVDGQDLAATEPVIATAYDAWEAAFELYRNHKIA